MEFKMERLGLVEPGQIVDVTEGVVAASFSILYPFFLVIASIYTVCFVTKL